MGEEYGGRISGMWNVEVRIRMIEVRVGVMGKFESDKIIMF